MGLLVGWPPVLVVASTVDRNTVSADSVRERLNSFVREIRIALLDQNTLERYRTATNSSDSELAWIEILRESEAFEENFFTTFGGIGRTHFHYGVAHPILSGIETKFIAEYGRGWLRHSAAARQAIVVGSRNVNDSRCLTHVWHGRSLVQHCFSVVPLLAPFSSLVRLATNLVVFW